MNLAHADPAAKPAALIHHDATPSRSVPRRSKAHKQVCEIVQHHFREMPRRIVREGGGLTNDVFAFTVAQGEFILRSHSDPAKINDYLKEQWAMAAARSAGVAAPHVLEVGHLADGSAYLIAERVQGCNGCSASNRLELLAAMGQAAAKLHGIRTDGFGPVFDWSSNRLSRYATWADWLKTGFDVEARLTLLQQHRYLDARQLGRLRSTARTMAGWRKRPVLHHGDLRLKNVLADPATGTLVSIIDWENAFSAPTPCWDLSLALHDLGADEQEAFLAGYGMAPAAYEKALPFVRFFNVLNYAKPIEAAAAQKNVARLASFHLRFRRGLDLYDV